MSKSGIVIPNQPKWHQRLGGFVLYWAMRSLAASLRCQWKDRSGFYDWADPGPAIYCIWHNRLALSMHIYFKFIRKRTSNGGLAAMVSASKDGAFLANVLEHFGVQPVRGSTSRRGPQALRELTSWARRNYDLAITPDGPRGPRYVAQEGVIALAQLTGRPIIPVSFNLGWKIRPNSWDRFLIPLPFSRCEFIFEKAFVVPRETPEAGREKFRLQLEQALNQISEP
jgi:lysophospholipid acyltransferase (LPLAT)-like uncharacterized protein